MVPTGPADLPRGAGIVGTGCLLAMLLLLPLTANGHSTQEVTGGADFAPQLGRLMPVALPLVDDGGRVTTLAKIAEGRPLLLLFGYFRCSDLCPTLWSSLGGALRGAGLTRGKDYEVAVVSIDPDDTPAAAAERKGALLARTGHPGQGWHFLTGAPEVVAQLTEAAGYRARRREEGSYIHAAGMLVLDGAGRIARVLQGVGFRPTELRLAVTESAAGRRQATYEKLLLLCFHYEPASGRYALSVMNLVRGGALLATLLLVAAWARLHRTTRRNHHRGGPWRR